MIQRRHDNFLSGDEGMGRFPLLACLALAGAINPRPAHATAAALYAECAKVVGQLQTAGIITGLRVHGNSPRGFDLLVNQGKWLLIDPSTQGTIVHFTACYVAQGDGTIQVSGIVHDGQTNKELGAMGLSGEYFPHAQGMGFSP